MKSISPARFGTLLAGSALIALTTPTIALAQDAAEEDSSAGPATGDVIIVTATKREQTLQETPVAVSVTTAAQLEQSQVRDLLDLQTLTPSLRVSQLQNSSNTTFIIRGFGNGDNNVGIEPSVGVFIDGVFRSRSAGQIGDMSNVQRVEVLRGPQSTLFGKNASAGVISIVTREPQFEFGGSAEISYGNRNAFVMKGDVTGPISETLAYSIDANYNVRDGYAQIVNLNTDVSDRKRWGTRGQLLFEPTADLKVRLIADYSKINEKCCTVANLVAGPTVPALFAVGGAVDPQNPFSYDIYLNKVPINKIKSYGFSGQIDYETGPFALTSITAWRQLDSFFDQDVDFTSADIVSEVRDQTLKTFTQEFRIASDFDGPLNFLLGGFYFDEKINQTSQLSTGNDGRLFFSLLGGDPLLFNGVELALNLPQNSIFSPGLLTSEQFAMDNTSYSLFGTVDFEVTDRLTLTAGFNYTKDKKDFALNAIAYDELANINMVDAFIAGAIGSTDPAVIAAFAGANQAAFAQIAGLATTSCGAGGAAPQPPACNPLLALRPFQFQPPFLNIPNAVEDGKTRDSDWSYTLRAAYEISDNLNAYVTYATGFKASSVNLSRDSRPSASDFTPGPLGSTILAPSSPIRDAGLAVANLGTGSRFAGPEDARVIELGLKGQFDTFAFNLAVFDQEIKGFQAFTFSGTGFILSNAGKQSTQGFEFDASWRPVDPLQLTFASTYLDPKYDSFVNSPVGNLSGQRPGGIPKWAISTGATYTHDFASGAKLIGHIDYNFESRVNINNGLPTYNASLGNTTIFTRKVSQFNGSLNLALDNGLELGIWGRNIFNQHYIMTVFDGVAQQGTVSAYPSPPRTYGASARIKF
ncbi:MAG: TonB-dependent receptor [Sphingomonadaceae bacterium]